MTEPITSSGVEFAANGGTGPGYLSRPQSDGQYPGIVLIQEWWGIDDHIKDGFMGLDIGPKTALRYSQIIKGSKTIVWNGPMGVFEWRPFRVGTRVIAEAIAEATANGAKSIIGGGDSVKALNKAGLGDQVTFMSTGGGASLEFLEGNTLPGVAALADK